VVVVVVVVVVVEVVVVLMGLYVHQLLGLDASICQLVPMSYMHSFKENVHLVCENKCKIQKYL
jgi:hypothetical protein